MNALPTEQIPGIYHRRVGDAMVTALSDGYLDAPYEVMLDIAPAEIDSIMAEAFRPSPPRISVNCFLVRSGGRTGIVDTGSSDSMGPTLGRLPAMLALLGIAPEDIDTVMLTHMHPDHSNGLTAKDGSRLFPNAELVVAEAEVNHWHDDAAMARANERQRVRYFEWGRFQVAPYLDRRRNAVGEVMPQVEAVPLPGHTPGHTGYRVASGDEAMLIWGDIVHVPDVQARRPDVTMVFDSDRDAAISSRRRTFDMAASDRLLIGGMHAHFPGFGHVARRGEGYVIEPEAWRFTL